MFEELNQHRTAVQENIQKAFEVGFTGSLDDIEIEKGKWKVGDTKEYQGRTWRVSGFNASGNPKWVVADRKQKGVTGAPAGSAAPATAKKQDSSTQKPSKTPSREEEIKGFINILKQKPNDRYFEIMDDGELKRFAESANKCWLDDENLNRSTRQQCKEWRDLAKQELASRVKEKKEDKAVDNAELPSIGEEFVYESKKNSGELIKVVGLEPNVFGFKKMVNGSWVKTGESKTENAKRLLYDYSLKEDGSKKQKQEKKKEPKVAKVPSGHRVYYEDDLVEVYDDKGKKVYSGLYDYCDYKEERSTWNEKDKNYDLPHGYKMVGKTKH